MSRWDPSIALRLILGGDNAATWHALRALSGGDYSNIGLVTLDAHLDMRDGVSNGSPVRQLLEEGLDAQSRGAGWTGRLLQLAGLRAARPRGRCHGDLARRGCTTSRSKRRHVERSRSRAPVDAASTLTSTWTPPIGWLCRPVPRPAPVA